MLPIVSSKEGRTSFSLQLLKLRRTSAEPGESRGWVPVLPKEGAD